MRIRYADAVVFDMVDALLRGHRPSACAECGRSLGLVASWRISLAADARTVVSGLCPSCAVLPKGTVPEATD